MAKAIFIDEEITVYEGEQARQLLEGKTAVEPIDEERGVTRVSRQRWQEAQRYERRTWLDKGRWSFTDRNEYHRERFAGYAALRGISFKQGIELGCGPFTNIRLLLEHCAIEQITLLDPLISDYLAHPFCRYRHGRLGGLLNEHPLRLPAYLKRPLTAIRSKANDYHTGGLFGRPVTLAEAMIESYQTDQRFDLLVMINVLEHCQDATAVFQKIDELLLPGGLFVYHDKIYRAEEVKRLSTMIYDAGHPLRVDQSVVEEFLNAHFTTLMRAEYLVQEEFRGLPLSYQELYTICRKV